MIQPDREQQRKVVEREPTEEMMEAGIDELFGEDDAHNVWYAMFDAAPDLAPVPVAAPRVDGEAIAMAQRWLTLEGDHFVIPPPVITRSELVAVARALLSVVASGETNCADHGFHEHISSQLTIPVRCGTCGAVVTAPSAGKNAEGRAQPKGETVDRHIEVPAPSAPSTPAADSEAVKEAARLAQECVANCQEHDARYILARALLSLLDAKERTGHGWITGTADVDEQNAQAWRAADAGKDKP